MHLQAATNHIRRCAERMEAVYQSAVFDEWVIISLADGKGRVVWYQGPRREDFQANFHRDVETLRAELLRAEHAVGEFEFAPHGSGTHFDAFLVVGRGLYLLCNHTGAAMNTIRQNPRWLAAQVPFADLSDQFRADPLTLA